MILQRDTACSIALSVFAGNIGEAGQRILSQGAQAASWLGDQEAEGAPERALNRGRPAGARGDQGRSAGPLQLLGGGGGQLDSIAQELGVGLEQAKQRVESNPVEAIKWALPPKSPLSNGAKSLLLPGLPSVDQSLDRTGQGPTLSPSGSVVRTKPW
jgi:hypothetical protein